jgi:hypothetical protein
MLCGVRKRLAATVAMVLGWALPQVARADAPVTPEAENASNPIHLAQAFLQYGLAFTGEFVVAPGPICTTAAVEGGCILGTGGGLALRVGRRLRTPFYIGAAYEFAKMDSAQLYRIGILQQARAEGRYYISTGHTTEPYVMASLGAAVYGNLWGVDTGGPAFSLGVGAEFQLSTYIVVGLSITYRALFFTQFTDSSERTPGQPCDTDPSCHPSGFAHLIGIDLIIETRDPL